MCREDELVEALAEATQRSRQQSELLAAVSHEIRNPMNGVVGLARLLTDSSLGETERRYALGIRDAAEALLRIVDELLDFSRLDAGRTELRPEPFDLQEAFASVVALLQPAAEAKGLVLTSTIAPDVPPMVIGDAGRVRQVLLNLLGNALKFTATGSVVLRGSVAETSPLVIRVEVEDTGVGIDGDLQRLFDPYTQGSTATARDHGGTGLGLAISARLVAAMGGTLAVQSRVGVGSTFQFDVPLERVSDPALEPLTAGADGNGVEANPVPKGTLLIVDDDRINRLVATAMVKRLGYRCDVAVNGADALAMLLTHDYDAVLMDCFMPEMDGLQATVELRLRENGGRHTPVLAMTASVLDEDRDKCKEAGMDDFALKPFTLTDLDALLERWAVPA